MKYKRDFLDKVICRADFVGPFEFKSERPPEAFYTAVKDRFPIAEFADKLQKTVTINAGPEKAIEENNHIREWVFHSKERTKKLTLTNTHLSVQYTKYEYYKSLRDDFTSALKALDSIGGNCDIKRLGMRYIDIFQGIPGRGAFEWNDLFIPEITASMKIVSDNSTLSRTLTVLNFNYGEDNLRFQYGIYNPDYPAPIKKQQFILDYDMSTSEILQVHQVEERIDRFHKKLIDSFEEVITDSLRNLMNDEK